MAENVRPPVAIRIVRPYDSEDELLEHELETIGKTSVVLIGAHPRPTGVILRFEVTLASGTTVLRGEGRVLAHKENAFRGQPGLTLRFTRLDPRSKSVVDRATAMREARSSSEASDPSSRSSPSRPVMSSPHVESPVADALTASTPAPGLTALTAGTAPPTAASGPSSDAVPFLSPAESAAASARAAAREKANATARANAKRTGSGRPMALTPPPAPSAPSAPPAPIDDEPATPAPTPVTSVPGEVAERPRFAAAPEKPRAAASSGASGGVHAPLEPPADRAELLARLRERAGKLPPDRIEEILSARR